jgi:hypothetical protein
MERTPTASSRSSASVSPPFEGVTTGFERHALGDETL